MWYTAEKKKKEKEKIKEGLDTKIIRNLAEQSIRHNLFLLGKYYPTQAQLKLLINRVLTKIQDKYKDPNLIRAKSTNENLAPIIESVVKGLL